MEGGRDRGRLSEEGEEGKLKGGRRGVRREGKREGGREKERCSISETPSILCHASCIRCVFFLSFLACFLSFYLIPSVDFPHFYCNILNFTSPVLLT